MLTLFSPAKINLFFRVLNKRSDGYHEIASLYHAVDLGDHISISFSSKDSISCTDPMIPTDENNLIHKAIYEFRSNFNKIFHVKVHLEKNIPIQSGLGGGSSNAATTLWGLNTLFDRPFSTDELIKMASKIGSDVPFFLSQGSAYCTGRGEVFINTKIPSFSCLLVKPNYGLLTPMVYQNMQLKDLKKVDPELTWQNFVQGKFFHFNDLETAAEKIKPRLLALKQFLYQSGFDSVVLTGSGTCYVCFGIGKAPSDLFFKSVKGVYRSKAQWY